MQQGAAMHLKRGIRVSAVPRQHRLPASLEEETKHFCAGLKLAGIPCGGHEPHHWAHGDGVQVHRCLWRHPLEEQSKDVQGPFNLGPGQPC